MYNGRINVLTLNKLQNCGMARDYASFYSNKANRLVRFITFHVWNTITITQTPP